jgi:ApbE superfamily uncharacterized protein (UPF0280 family)
LLGNPVPRAIFSGLLQDIHIFSNTLSTLSVKMVCNHMKFRDFSVKVDPGDRGIYRGTIRGDGLTRFEVSVKETDLLVLAERDLSGRVRETVITERDRLERYLAGNAAFLHSLAPVAVPATAAPIVRAMAAAGAAAGVGPMAAVAGAICDAVARDLADETRELIIENGGDLYVRVARERIVGIFTGERPGPALGLRVRPAMGPLGICTSSGRIGHSLSLGDSAAATVVAGSCALADAAATAVGNHVRGAQGIRAGLAAARAIPGVLGAVILRAGELGAWGALELAELAGGSG